MPTPTDDRSAQKVMRQWEKLMTIKNQLVKQGLLDGNATPTQVLDKIRSMVPPELFT